MSEHPKDRPIDAEDPFQLAAGRVAGDPGLMLACVVEEFARMSLSEAEILELFETPEFLATHGLAELFGPEETRRRVRAVLARCGVLRVKTTVRLAEPACPALGLPSSPCHWS